MKRTPSQRNGSGSQFGERWLTRGSAVSVGLLAQDQAGQDPSGEVGRRHPVTGVAPTGRDPGSGIEGERRDPVPGHAQGAAPGVPEADPAQAGEPGLDHRPERGVGPGVAIEGRLDRRAEAIRCATAAEQDPPIGGPRQVVDRQAVGRDDLAGAPADRGPVRIGDGLGQDDERIERQQGPVVAPELAEVGLAGQDDGGRPDEPSRRPQGRPQVGQGARLDIGHGGPLEDRAAPALDRPSQAAHELARVDHGVLAAVDRAQGTLDPDPIGRLGGVEPAIAGGPARSFQARPVCLQGRHLLRPASDRERATLGVVRLDPLGGNRFGDRIHGSGHGVLDRAHAGPAERSLEPLGSGVQP